MKNGKCRGTKGGKWLGCLLWSWHLGSIVNRLQTNLYRKVHKSKSISDRLSSIEGQTWEVSKPISPACFSY